MSKGTPAVAEADAGPSVPSASPLILRDALRALPDYSFAEVPRVVLLKLTGK